MRRGFLILLIAFLALFTHVPQALALSMTIEAPSEQLVRDQEYDFVVSIDTFNTAITTTQGRVTYETEYLQFVSLTKGNFFESVTYTEASTGTIIITGTNAAAKSGSGTFAIIRFKLIATAAGSTTLCAIAPITPTSTPPPTNPTTPPQSCSLSCTSDANCAGGLSCINGMCLNATCPAETDCICPVPTKIPPPAAIPTSGMAVGWKVGSFIALGLIGLGILGVILL
ncbi:hypothetical protein A2313_00080 [Candidatus Roizmanbacteria bacterium RIFOXYB2_FULL_41_10]|uniref:Cohesin domain-containing protein n=1 Tax=Candidatus Roizmanbacteria bacterium RIFOXYA1_FULL_41_12 TaxID=1802082 RepID=A0A1F7KAR3_9BACT|nr:MAG: hypothetical protein A2209_04640 [Candidatus Roizmanbacteria bacterium RIFOXYA1_FULL_41_12]OGK66788.1 MAG: hypothetical protein A2377_02685 [Candidatus Roizmanbacteria bacterium RIFOXYB1_FULL_41_27]OGK68037.1 MAG: hypothetical protein A2262_00240 [Candidatus Roizmanbacteria bacterium RIFOXYA2_FULL_41_8]OGK71371.1 MAG: hypothetical protein A2313_00080 [Candidatus Roizmanbacteria bacterium RIFOXYB2_FULL_41_10]OGK75583.1 MAG: hypothetical protein A2575_02680 [Candidatus Roizmanbacteria bac